MLDYSDYDDDSEYEVLSDEDDYAGAYGGGYNDLYDDVLEEADFDAWNIVNREFNFDEESPLFEFDPFAEYFDLEVQNADVIMTYQALSELSEMTARLLKAWEKRSTADHSETEVSDSDPIYFMIFFSENIEHIVILPHSGLILDSQLS